MRGRAVLGSLWALALALPATAQDAAAPRAPADAVPPLVVDTRSAGAERGFPPIMTIDQERLFMGSLWGQRVQAEVERRSREIAAENERLASQFAAEEQELTTLRGTLPPEEFRQRADEFDKRVVAVRRERDTVARDLDSQVEQERTAFLRAALPVLAQVMEERGAVVVLDQSAIFVSAQSVDVTGVLIDRINRDIGAGKPVATSGQAAPQPQPQSQPPAAGAASGGPTP